MPGGSGPERTTMDRKKTMATAAALVLTVTGGVSALFLTVGPGDTATAPTAGTEIVQYVDAAGNRIPAASAGGTSLPSTGAQVDTSPAGTTRAKAQGEDDHDQDQDHDERHEEEDHDD